MADPSPPAGSEDPGSQVLVVNPLHQQHGTCSSSARFSVSPMELEVRPLSDTDAETGLKSPKSRGQTQAAPPRWLSGNTVLCLALLSGTTILAGFYCVLHVTPAVQVMAGMVTDPLPIFDVTPAVQVFAGLLFLSVVAYSAIVTVTITCFWRRTVDQMLREDMARAEMKTQSAVVSIYYCVEWFIGTHSPFFLWLVFALEVAEFCVQALAVDQILRAGVGDIAAAIYATVIFCNGFCPMALAWITHRRVAMGAEADTMRAKVREGQLIARVMLFDALCDLLYGLFPIINLLIRYFILYGRGFEDYMATYGSGIPEDAEYMARTLNGIPRRGRNQPRWEPAMLASEAKAVLFGSHNSGDIMIKFASRGFPLLLAPLRIRRGFVTRKTWHRSSAVLTRLRERRPQGSTGTSVPRTSTKRNVLSRAASIVRSTSQKAVERLGHQQSSSSSSSSSHDGRPQSLHRPVPWWAAIALNVAVVAFCLTVYIRLGTWGECQVEKLRRSCVVTAHPIFQSYDLPERGCSCNFLVFVDESCRQQKNTTATARQQADAVVPAPASVILNKHPAVLSSASVVFIQACPTDVGLLQTLTDHAPNMESIVLDFHDAGDLRLLPVSWSFPDNFGSNGPIMWPLAQFQLFGDNAIRLESLPRKLAQMTAMKSIIVASAGLTELPEDIGQSTKLSLIDFPDNKLTTLPDSFGLLTNLHLSLLLPGNRLTHVPRSLARLTGLRFVSFSNNSLESIDPAVITAPRPNSAVFDFESNNLSASAVSEVLDAIAATDESSITPSSPSLIMAALNPACTSLPGQVGSWQINCKPACASGCFDSSVGDVTSWVGDGFCDAPCNVEGCGFDVGDCD